MEDRAIRLGYEVMVHIDVERLVGMTRPQQKRAHEDPER
jgi:hypothetical protein